MGSVLDQEASQGAPTELSPWKLESCSLYPSLSVTSSTSRSMDGNHGSLAASAYRLCNAKLYQTDKRTPMEMLWIFVVTRSIRLSPENPASASCLHRELVTLVSILGGVGVLKQDGSDDEGLKTRGIKTDRKEETREVEGKSESKGIE